MAKDHSFYGWISRNTYEDNAMISFIRFFSFCLSSIVGILIIEFEPNIIFNLLFVFSIPISFNLGIDIYKCYRSKEKGIFLVIVLIILLAIYSVITFISIIGLFDNSVVSPLLSHKLLLGMLILSYAYAYVVEIILLIIHNLIQKYRNDNPEKIDGDYNVVGAIESSDK